MSSKPTRTQSFGSGGEWLPDINTPRRPGPEDGTLTDRAGWHHFARHALPFEQEAAEVSMQCGGSYLQSARAKQARRDKRPIEARGAQTSEADFVEAEFHEHVDSSHQLRHLQLENRELKKQLAALVEQSPGGSKKRSAGENNRRRVVERETMPVNNTEWEQLRYKSKLAEREKQVAQAESKALRKQVNWLHGKSQQFEIREQHHLGATRVSMLIFRFASNTMSWALRTWSEYVVFGQEEQVRSAIQERLTRQMRDAVRRALAALQWASVLSMFEMWKKHHCVMQELRAGTLERNLHTEVLQSVSQHLYSELHGTSDFSGLLSKVCDLAKHMILAQHASVHVLTHTGVLEPLQNLFSKTTGQRVIHGMGLSTHPYTACPVPPPGGGGSSASRARKSQLLNSVGLMSSIPAEAVDSLCSLAMHHNDAVMLSDFPDMASTWPELTGLIAVPVNVDPSKFLQSSNQQTPKLTEQGDEMELGASRKRRSQLGNQVPPPVAVMVFANVTSGKSFDETRLVLLRALMEMAAPALGQAQLFTQHVLQLQQLESMLGSLEDKEVEVVAPTDSSIELDLQRSWSNLGERQAASMVLVRAILKPLCAEKGTIVFIDNTTEELLYQAPTSQEEGEIRKPFKRECVVGSCIMNGDLINIWHEGDPTSQSDLESLKEMEQLFGIKVTSLLCVPVMANDGTVLGAVLVVNRIGAAKFSSEDHLAITSFSKAHCARAISLADRDSRLEATHVRMYDHERMVVDLAKEASLETFALGQCEKLATLVQCEQVQLFIKERESSEFMRFRLSKNGDADISIVPMSSGIVMDCFQKEQIDHVLEPLSDPRYGAHVDGSGRSQAVQNMLLVPLQASLEEKPIGVLQAFNKQCDESSTESFSLMDQAQLGVSAGHAAATIVGFKLTERLAVTETQLGNLQKLTISTTKAHSTGGDELQLLLGLLARMVDAKLSCMYLVARGGHPVLELKATYHGKEGRRTTSLVGHARKRGSTLVASDDDIVELTSSVQLSQGIMGQVALSGTTVHTNFVDIGGELIDPSQLFDKAVDAPDAMQVNTLVSVPLCVADGPVLGVCQFVNKCNRAVFSRSDVLTLNAAAGLVGMAIVNADLQGQVAQVEQRFSSLQDLVRKALTPARTTSEDKIDHVLTHCRRVLCADVLMLYKANSRENTFHNVAIDASLQATGYWSRGYSINMVKGNAVFGQGIVGLCAISGEKVNSTLECRNDDALDVMDSQGRFDKSIDAPANYPVRSLLCMPIKDPATGILIGVIEALDKNDSMLPDPVEFDAEDESLLSVMAVMIAEDLSKTQYNSNERKSSVLLKKRESETQASAIEDEQLEKARETRRRRSSNFGLEELVKLDTEIENAVEASAAAEGEEVTEEEAAVLRRMWTFTEGGKEGETGLPEPGKTGATPSAQMAPVPNCMPK